MWVLKTGYALKIERHIRVVLKSELGRVFLKRYPIECSYGTVKRVNLKRVIRKKKYGSKSTTFSMSVDRMR